MPFIQRVRYGLLGLGLQLPRLVRSIWVHGPDVDSFRAAEALINALRQRCRDHRIVLTIEGHNQYLALIRAFPNDFVVPTSATRDRRFKRFLRHIAPRIRIVLGREDGIETGLPLRVAAAHLPCAIVNAEAASAAGSQHCNDYALCVLRTDSGPQPLVPHRTPGLAVEVGGILDFDIPMSVPPTREPTPVQRKDNRYVLFAAGIADGEAAAAMRSLNEIRTLRPNALLLLSPADGSDGSTLETRLSAHGYTCEHYPEGLRTADIVMLDPDRDRPWLMTMADLVILGGGFLGTGVPVNPARAIATGKPTLVGRFASERDHLTAAALHAGVAKAVAIADLPAATRAAVGDGDDALGRYQRAARLLQRHAGATDHTLRALDSLLPPPCATTRGNEGWWLYGPVPRFSRTMIGRGLARLLSRTRLSDLSRLRDHLGHPRSILCLGNGPSSEDPALKDIAYDCLIRANARWRHRGLFDHPDLIVVGDFDTLAHLPGQVFVYRDRACEIAAVLRGILHFGRVSRHGIALDDLPTCLRGMTLDGIPSSGALMVALASALQPERLTIAGIDLFSDQRGRYPGDPVGVNAYAQAHSREVDLAVIKCALNGFSGELVIVGDVLRHVLDGESIDPPDQTSPARPAAI